MSVPLLLDGPCHGWYADHQLQRAPERLVAVVAPGGAAAIFDQPDDQPSYGESCWVYERSGMFFIDGTRAVTCSGWSYRVVGRLDWSTGEVTAIAPEQRARWHAEQTEQLFSERASARRSTIPTTQEALF